MGGVGTSSVKWLVWPGGGVIPVPRLPKAGESQIPGLSGPQKSGKPQAPGASNLNTYDLVLT